MGDRYQPARRHGEERYDDRYDTRYSDRSDHYYDHRFDSRHGERDAGRYDPSYDSRYSDRAPPRDHYEPSGRYDQRPAAGFTFRGAADRDSYAPPPPADFTFRAQGPAAPRFPPSDSSAPRTAPSQSSAGEFGRRGRGNNRGQRGGPGRGRGQRGGFFKPAGAHQRDLLTTSHRETTPEQLEGMNMDGHTRFKSVDSSSDDDGGAKIVDLTHSSDEGEAEAAAPRKRNKLRALSETAAPKWSNPDPYTVLPPTDAVGLPKKDIVQVIRKAKVDAANGTDARGVVKEADFISLNFGDDFDDDMASVVDKNPPPSAPTGPSSGFTAINSAVPPPLPEGQLGSFGAFTIPPPPPEHQLSGPPPPPHGFVMPTDEELAAQMADANGGKKRKRGPGSGAASDVRPEWQAHGTDSTPWCQANHATTSNTGLRLHKEIKDFYAFVRPFEHEEAVRRNLIRRILLATRQSPTANAGSVDVQCFGSFAAGLYLPTADMDLVAVSPKYMAGGQPSYCQHKRQMYNLGNHLQTASIASTKGFAVIWKAKVPIIKFIDQQTDIKVDISFENDSGLKANHTFQAWKQQFPQMPTLVVLIKQLLAMRGLNEVYSGGIGGFTIICLVVSMLQLNPQVQAGAMHPDLHYGDLLLEFLDLYGNRFDVVQTGITMNPPGYFDKPSHRNIAQNPDRLTIIDPNRPENDISGGSSKINAVLDCFRLAHSKIQRRLAEVRAGEGVGESILGCILGGNYSSFISQREKLGRLHQKATGFAPPPPAPTFNQGPPPSSRAKKELPKKAARAPPQPPPSRPPAPPTHSLPAKPNGSFPIPTQHVDLPAYEPMLPRNTTPSSDSDFDMPADYQVPSTRASNSVASKKSKSKDGQAKVQMSTAGLKTGTKRSSGDAMARSRALDWIARHPDAPEKPELLSKKAEVNLNKQYGSAQLSKAQRKKDNKRRRKAAAEEAAEAAGTQQS